MADADTKLRNRIDWLNNNAGLNGPLAMEKVYEAAFGLEISNVMRILKELEEKKETVKDPTAYVCAALRKAGGGAGGAPAPAPMGYPAPPDFGAGGDDARQEQNLRKRINWLNGTGGFEGKISYEKIISAAKGLEYNKVFDVLKKLESKQNDGGQVNDPTGWVCAGLRKLGGASQSGYPAATLAFAPPSGAPGMDADTKLRKRIEWLNSAGGFGGRIDQDKIYAAARGLEINVVMKVLKELEQNRDTVKDPNAYAGAALRKMGGGGAGPPAGYAPPAAMPPPPMAYPGAFAMPPEDPYMAAAYGGAGGDAADEDKKLRRRIGWMNKAGGFDGAIHYQKIVDAAKGLEYSEVMRLLKDVEGKKETIRDPTGWVCAALKKLGGGGGVPAAPPMYPMPVPGMAAPLPFAPVAENEADEKLRKRVAWLNERGGFNNALDYPKVVEAATGLEIREVMELLKEVEGKKDQLRDPTGYTVVALRKRKERAMGGLPDAKRMRT
mmetsp:Transcript_65796/g.189687  ORF Transcript_65796/g.189687 Transcript_65796/m.189687 type:complete len:495 (-) Transcript_65796:118-1602(-)